MDGVEIVQALLDDDAGIAAFTPAIEITSGVLWDAATRPALTVSDVSGVPRNILSPGATRHVTDRVQVTAIGDNYPQVKDVLMTVRKALADKVLAEVAGASNVTVHWDSKGPDFMNEEASLY
jgi:hypothetical protein